MRLRALPLLCLAALAPLLAQESWDRPGAGNPILPGYFADPSLVQHEGRFYLYATLDPWGGRTLGCWESSDFSNWTYRDLNWPTKEACTSPTSKGAMVWAPSVIRAPDGQFRMYISVGSEIWAGVAPHPLGPWRDANGGRPLVPATWNPAYHQIDAEAFVDDDGSLYLYWGSGWKWVNGRCFAVKLRADGVTFDGEPRDVTPANYFEGPFVFKHAGRYYLTYSQGKTVTDTYEVRYAVGDTPFGPFTEAPTSPVLVTDHARRIISPGHHALFQHAGRTYILYHRHRIPYVADTAYRQVCIDEVHITPEGRIAAIQPTHQGPATWPGARPRALPVTVRASSALSPLHDASRAIDNNFATRWAPAEHDPAPWLVLDLGTLRTVDRLELRPEMPAQPTRLTVEISTDGHAWERLADHARAGLSGSPLVIPLARPCRQVRLTFPAAEPTQSRSLWECSLY